MRTPQIGLQNILDATGASADSSRLIGVQLDLTDSASITTAAKAIIEAVGAPNAVVHNAGITAVGCVEELDLDVWQQLFATNLFGPVALTNALLPSMRAAGRGRIVVIASENGVRGMPSTASYSASKAGSERWAEALAAEIAPFGLGVSVLVTGVFDTDIITDAGVQDHRDFSGPYGALSTTIERRGRLAIRMASPPSTFRARTGQGPRRYGTLRPARRRRRRQNAAHPQPVFARQGDPPDHPHRHGPSTARRRQGHGRSAMPRKRGPCLTQFRGGSSRRWLLTASWSTAKPAT